MYAVVFSILFVFFHDTATTEIYTLSLHDALPICYGLSEDALNQLYRDAAFIFNLHGATVPRPEQYETGRLRSEEHTSELQSLRHLVCRLLLEKKKQKKKKHISNKHNQNNIETT